MTGLLLPSDSHHGIADRVQRGDPVVGWRGDHRMDTYLDERRGVCEVYAFDERGTRYCAVRVDARLPGWQHDLLRRLRDGDYRRADQFLEELYASEERKAKDKEHQRQELVGEMVDAVEGPLASAFGLGKRFH